MRHLFVTLPVVGVLGLALGWSACKKAAPPGDPLKKESVAGEIQTKTDKVKAKVQQGSQPSAGAPRAEVATRTGNTIGIPECDAYLAKMEKCLGKVPEAGRPMMQRTLDLTRDAWRKSSATAEGKAGLRAACKVAATTAQAATAPYKCEW
jgi:hypothetical protein